MPADIDPLKRATDMADEMRMEADAPGLPEPAFRLKWKGGAYYVSEPNIGDTDCYTADQMRAMAADRDSLRQALWDVHAALGFDTDGDKTPDALVTPIGPMVVAAAEEFRRDYEEAIAAPSAVAAEDARAISYHRDDEGHEAIEAYAKIVASVDKEEALPRLANLVAHGARATLGPGGVVLTRSDWKTLKITPLATTPPAPAFADMTADRDSWQKQASQFLDDALVLARQMDEAVKEYEALRAFALDVMQAWPHGDVDGGSLQGYAVTHGLLLPETRHAPCCDGGGCMCAEYVSADEWPAGVECFRKTARLTGAITQSMERKT